MKTVDFTAIEIRLLNILLETNPCESGCAFEEQTSNKKDCNDCVLVQTTEEIRKKICLI